MSQPDPKAPLAAPPAQPPGEMPRELVQFMAGGQTCILSTVDEQSIPLTSLMTWVVARDPLTVTVAVDQRGRALRNLRKNPQVAVEVLGDGVTFGLRGRAAIEKESMDKAPFPCALVAIRIEECRNHAAPGVTFFGPRYTFDQGKEHRLAVEQSVFAELKGEPPPI